MKFLLLIGFTLAVSKWEDFEELKSDPVVQKYIVSCCSDLVILFSTSTEHFVAMMKVFIDVRVILDIILCFKYVTS